MSSNHFKMTSDTAMFIHKLQVRIDDEIIELNKSGMENHSIVIGQVMGLNKALSMITRLIEQLESHEIIEKELEEDGGN